MWGRILIISFLVQISGIRHAAASQIHWTLGGNYMVSSYTFIENDTSISTILSSTLVYSFATTVEIQLGSATTYFYLGGSGEYQAAQYDVSLTPGIPSTPIISLGEKLNFGFHFWKLKLGGYYQIQDLYLISNNAVYELTKNTATGIGGNLELLFLSRTDLDILIRANYSQLAPDSNILSGNEIGAGLYLQVGSTLRWTIGGGLINRAFTTSSGTQTTNDFQAGFQFTLPLQITVQPRTGGSGGQGSASNNRRTY